MILERISDRVSSPEAAYDLLAFLPALRVLTAPFPPGVFAARFFAAVIFPPLLLVLLFAMGRESHDKPGTSVQLRTIASRGQTPIARARIETRPAPAGAHPGLSRAY